MTSSLYTYRGMPLNEILATNEDDNASGITKVDNPLENYFKEFNNPTTYNLLTTTAANVRQDLTNVIYTVPGLSSLAGRNYSAYYKEYNADTRAPTSPLTRQPTKTRTHTIDLTAAKACFSYIIVILIGGSGAGFPGTNNTGTNNGGSGACVIYQINLGLMGNKNIIEIDVGRNSIEPGNTQDENGLAIGTAGATTLYVKYLGDNGIMTRDVLAIARGGISATSTTQSAPSTGTANTSILNFPYYRSSITSSGQTGNDANNVYTINGYRFLLGFNATTRVINNTIWPIFYNNPNCYGGTQAPYVLPYSDNNHPTPESGYARVYYML